MINKFQINNKNFEKYEKTINEFDNVQNEELNNIIIFNKYSVILFNGNNGSVSILIESLVFSILISVFEHWLIFKVEK